MENLFTWGWKAYGLLGFGGSLAVVAALYFLPALRMLALPLLAAVRDAATWGAGKIGEGIQAIRVQPRALIIVALALGGGYIAGHMRCAAELRDRLSAGDKARAELAEVKRRLKAAPTQSQGGGGWSLPNIFGLASTLPSDVPLPDAVGALAASARTQGALLYWSRLQKRATMAQLDRSHARLAELSLMLARPSPEAEEGWKVAEAPTLSPGTARLPKARPRANKRVLASRYAPNPSPGDLVRRGLGWRV